MDGKKEGILPKAKPIEVEEKPIDVIDEFEVAEVVEDE